MNRQLRRRGSTARRAAAAGITTGLVVTGALAGIGVTAAGALDIGGQNVPVQETLQPIDDAAAQIPTPEPLPQPGATIDDAAQEVVDGIESAGGGTGGGAPGGSLPLDPTDPTSLSDFLGGGSTDPLPLDPTDPGSASDVLGGGGSTDPLPLDPTDPGSISDVLAGGAGGGGGSTPPDPGAAVEEGLTELLAAIKDAEGEICASPLGDVLRQIGEGTAPVTEDVKAQLLEGLTEALTQAGTQLDQEQLGLLPTAIDVFVLDGLFCPTAAPAGPGDDDDDGNGNGNGHDDDDDGNGKGNGNDDGSDDDHDDDGGDPTVGTDSDPIDGAEGAGSGGGTLPFTGAGALTLGGLGAGLVGAGQLVRRAGHHRRSH